MTICSICTTPLQDGEMASKFVMRLPEGQREYTAHAHCLALYKERNKKEFKQ